MVNSGRYKNGDTFGASATGNSYKIQYNAADVHGARGYCSFDIGIKGRTHLNLLTVLNVMFQDTLLHTSLLLLPNESDY